MKRYGVLSLLVLFILGILLGDGFLRFLSPPPVKDPSVQTVRILPGMSLQAIAHHLTRKGIIQDPYKFMVLTWIKGQGKKIQWGDFELYPGIPPRVLLSYLTTGKTMLKRVTIPEGFTIQQIAKRLAEENLVEEEVFLTSARDPQLLETLEIDGQSLEGYLFPDTYIFHRGMTPRIIQKRMVQRFKEVFSGLQKQGEFLSAQEIKKMVILASIVEKESGVQSERPIIAAVFLNRLQKGMALQSDPTVIYGIKDFDGDLTKKNLSTRTAYNTYLQPGLPPGPIANPGKDSLQAVLSPAKSEYLYFVSKNDGSHFFSKNLKDHNRAVAQYQLSRKETR
ncbi:MAG: endolytic transglycosylase MltG [Deltaproteobacteria bacterium]|nr:endolytic transglycosylase MltG [Deltaproteobacteria bacterium]